ncbi:MAG TPA: hypothetical protein VM890_04145 [Longimicrobium sp.]|jgi:hypothetical protein|nr:hypothetical protein [Longimicrobium sp.]
MMSLQILARTCAALAAFAVVAASPAVAQSSPPGGALPPVGRMLQVFEEDAAADRTGGTEGIAAVQWALMHQPQVAPAKLDSVLAGLERMATQSPTRLARVRAVIQLGRDSSSTGFDRMMRVYRAAAAHPEVRDMLISSVHTPKLPREVEAWITLLRGLVVQPADAEDFPDAAFEAMRQLYALKDPGIAVLRDLHQRGAARNPEVRALLASWARQGFHLQESGPG